MRQFDVFPNPDPDGAEAHPYILVLQSDFVSDTDSVVVAPLVRRESTSRLYPRLQVDGEVLSVVITDLAAFPRRLLQQPITNAERERHRIIQALDLLFTGV